MKIIKGENRKSLVEAIQRQAAFWDASADSAARSAVDGSKRENADELMSYARECLAYQSAAHKLRDEVIQLINQYWPYEEDNKK